MTSKPNALSKSLTYRAFIWLGIVVACIFLLVKQWILAVHAPIETNILKLLPQNQQQPIVEQAFQSIADNLSNQIVLAISAPEENLIPAAQKAEQTLSSSHLFRSVTGQVDKDQQQQWASYFYQSRFQHLTPEQRELLQSAPDQLVTQVLHQVYNPFSGVTGSELQNDPFLLFRDYLSHVNQLSSNFSLKDGFLYTKYQDRPYILITANLAESPYSRQGSEAVALINQLEEDIKQTFDATSRHTGVVFYADFGTQSAKHEISTIGLFSLLGVVALVLIVFRSTTPLFLALLSITVGILCALAVTTLAFGQVHLFSLVFGASLIGVSIDYAFHYLTERLNEGSHWHSEQGLNHIFVAITLGLITSLIGYLGMLVAPFPGLQQLAVFSAAGLLAAYATVITWYPLLAKKPSADRALPGKWLLNQWFVIWNRPSVRMGLPLATLLLSLFGLMHAKYDDDIRQLQALPHALKQQEMLIANLTGHDASQQMLLVTANSEELLLAELERIDSQLSSWKTEGALGNYQSISQYVKSSQTQQHDYELISALYQNQGQALASTLNLAQVPMMNEPFSAITLDDFIVSPVSEPLRFLYLGNLEQNEGTGIYASVVTLNGLKDDALAKDLASSYGNIYYLNKAEEISNLFAEYRVKIFELLALALVAIVLVLTKRYGLKHSLLIVAPSIIACVAGIAATVLLGSTLNLFNLLALILIVGIGIDYTLFFAEETLFAEKTQSESTLLAITLSAITTLLSFGLLALSDTHAIHSFGLTVLSGIFVAWLLAPLAIRRPS